MSEDEYGYQEDFDENEAELQEAFPDHNNNREEDDEQHAQKINGKLESLQQQIESLQQDLDNERQVSGDLRRKCEEYQKAATEGENWKRKCLLLKEEYDMILITGGGGGSGGGDKVPPSLEEAFHRLCDSGSLFPEHKDKTLSTADCLNIIKLSVDANKRRKKSFSANADIGSAPSSADGAALRSTNTVNRLSERVRNLEEELRIAENAAKDAESMKAKIFQASERIRIEKEQKRALEVELNATKKKVEMLGDHIEKLVVHIKREGAQKVRLAEQVRAHEKEAVKLKEKSEYIQKKSAAKDRFILELREGSKVLEDQLRLMDEKYLELRGKLDYARAIAAKKIKRAERTAADLRMKFAMTGSPLVLDSIQLPGEFSTIYGAGEEAFDNDDHGWGTDSRSGLLPPKKSSSIRSLHTKGKQPKHVSLETMSLNSGISQRSEPTLDGVLDKIRYQTGNRGDWTEEKAKLLAKSR